MTIRSNHNGEVFVEFSGSGQAMLSEAADAIGAVLGVIHQSCEQAGAPKEVIEAGIHQLLGLALKRYRDGYKLMDGTVMKTWRT